MKSEMKKEFAYLKLYHFFRSLIVEQKLPPGTRLPSLRSCAAEYHVSRTTAEAAYLQLAADGYIISRPQSGYYVTELMLHRSDSTQSKSSQSSEILYDLSSTGVDRDSFRFDLWRRYIKSALRQDERLLSYGEPQGELDFREVLAQYIRTQRNILCSPEDIVVGAGVQSLLQILCPILLAYERNYSPDTIPKHESNYSPDTIPAENLSVSFPNRTFSQGIRIFQDFGFPVHYRDKDSRIIYVTPAHMTKWGEIMPVSRRLELIRYAAEHHSLVIEDDLENEFVYLQKPTPSLFSLAGGKDIIYIGSFSRLLLPSIRISFMILPPVLKAYYQKRAALYNQTASKSEQIALAQFIRDGHLAAQTRRLKRLYSGKLKLLSEAVRECFGSDCQIRTGAAGTSLALTLSWPYGEDSFLKAMQKQKLKAQVLESTTETITILLSASSLRTEDFSVVCAMLHRAVERDHNYFLNYSKNN